MGRLSSTIRRSCAPRGLTRAGRAAGHGGGNRHEGGGAGGNGGDSGTSALVVGTGARAACAAHVPTVGAPRAHAQPSARAHWCLLGGPPAIGLRWAPGGLRGGRLDGPGGGVHVSTDLRGSSRPARGRRGAVAPAPAFSWWRARDRRVKLMDRTRPLASPPGRSIPRAHESALGREGRARGGMARAARPTSAGRFLQQQFTIVWPFRLQGSELDTVVSCRITHGCLLRTSGRPHFLSNASRMSPTCSSSAPT